jgi:hypothetical protein
MPSSITHHELGRRGTLRQPLFDEGIGEDDFSQLNGDIILIGCAILSDRRTDGYWRNRNVLPDVLLWSSVRGPHAEKLAVLFIDE